MIMTSIPMLDANRFTSLLPSKMAGRPCTTNEPSRAPTTELTPPTTAIDTIRNESSGWMTALVNPRPNTAR